jgi:hypothetical protein
MGGEAVPERGWLVGGCFPTPVRRGQDARATATPTELRGGRDRATDRPPLTHTNPHRRHTRPHLTHARRTQQDRVRTHDRPAADDQRRAARPVQHDAPDAQDRVVLNDHALIRTLGRGGQVRPADRDVMKDRDVPAYPGFAVDDDPCRGVREPEAGPEVRGPNVRATPVEQPPGGAADEATLLGADELVDEVVHEARPYRLRGAWCAGCPRGDVK